MPERRGFYQSHDPHPLAAPILLLQPEISGRQAATTATRMSLLADCHNAIQANRVGISATVAMTGKMRACVERIAVHISFGFESYGALEV
jgi:hypothetical protein